MGITCSFTPPEIDITPQISTNIKEDAVKSVCYTCEQTYIKLKSDTWQRFCSRKCSNTEILHKICIRCNRDFCVTKIDNHKNICSRPECFILGVTSINKK